MRGRYLFSHDDVDDDEVLFFGMEYNDLFQACICLKSWFLVIKILITLLLKLLFKPNTHPLAYICTVVHHIMKLYHCYKIHLCLCL